MYDPIDVNEEIYIPADEMLDAEARSEDTRLACRAAADAYHARRAGTAPEPMARPERQAREFRGASETDAASARDLSRRSPAVQAKAERKQARRRRMWRRVKRDAEILIGVTMAAMLGALLAASLLGWM